MGFENKENHDQLFETNWTLVFHSEITCGYCRCLSWAFKTFELCPLLFSMLVTQDFVVLMLFWEMLFDQF